MVANKELNKLLYLLQELSARLQGCEGVKPASRDLLENLENYTKDLAALRGRPLLYPQFPTGRASGPYVAMEDGSVKLDMITGIGVHLFGHQHPKLVWEGLRAVLRAPNMQGTLMPSHESLHMHRLLKLAANDLPHLTALARAKMEGVWLTTCGTMANELALKILRQKKAPDYKVISFKRAFAGRSLTMGELTDEAKYREGQPVFDQFFHVDFYQEELSLEENVTNFKNQVSKILEKEKIAGMFFEPIQGEGGAFADAPRQWWVQILDFARSQNLALCFDEVQTFARTGEMFCFQRLELGDYVDLVTCAKPLQAGAVLWTKDFSPRPGLIAGTFSGHSVALAQGVKVMEMLIEENFLGPEGKIMKLEAFIKEDWKKRCVQWKDYGAGKLRINGGMIAFEILDGSMEKIGPFLQLLYKNGLIAFSAGRNPVCLRFLPPMGVLKEEHWIEAMGIVDKSLREFS